LRAIQDVSTTPRPPVRCLDSSGLDRKREPVEEGHHLDDLVVLQSQERRVIELDRATGGGKFGTRTGVRPRDRLFNDDLILLQEAQSWARGSLVILHDATEASPSLL
jgi:hypothetical protein